MIKWMKTEILSKEHRAQFLISLNLKNNFLNTIKAKAAFFRIWNKAVLFFCAPKSMNFSSV